jgi:hypothetical protein
VTTTTSRSILTASFDQEEGALGDRRTESSGAKADVNRNLRMVVERFDRSERDEDTWDFLCECGDDSCREWVTMPVSEYEALQRTDEPILAEGHQLDEGQRARRKARHLADGSKALRAQAEHQLRRAERNLRNPPSA